VGGDWGGERERNSLFGTWGGREERVHSPKTRKRPQKTRKAKKVTWKNTKKGRGHERSRKAERRADGKVTPRPLALTGDAKKKKRGERGGGMNRGATGKISQSTSVSRNKENSPSLKLRKKNEKGGSVRRPIPPWHRLGWVKNRRKRERSEKQKNEFSASKKKKKPSPLDGKKGRKIRRGDGFQLTVKAGEDAK